MFAIYSFIFRMPGLGPKNFPCVLCNKRTKPRERRKISKREKRFLQKQYLVTVKHENDTLCNKYLSGQEDDVAVGARMLYLSHQVNTLKERVEMEHLDTRRSTVWKEATQVVDFPRLSEERLRELTCGTYQLKLSKSYIQEHVDGKNDIFVHQEDPNLLKVKL